MVSGMVDWIKGKPQKNMLEEGNTAMNKLQCLCPSGTHPTDWDTSPTLDRTSFSNILTILTLVFPTNNFPTKDSTKWLLLEKPRTICPSHFTVTLAGQMQHSAVTPQHEAVMKHTTTSTTKCYILMSSDPGNPREISSSLLHYVRAHSGKTKAFQTDLYKQKSLEPQFAHLSDGDNVYVAGQWWGVKECMLVKCLAQ